MYHVPSKPEAVKAIYYAVKPMQSLLYLSRGQISTICKLIYLVQFPLFIEKNYL
jgi:hypothetical protein